MRNLAGCFLLPLRHSRNQFGRKTWGYRPGKGGPHLEPLLALGCRTLRTWILRSRRQRNKPLSGKGTRTIAEAQLRTRDSLNPVQFGSGLARRSFAREQRAGSWEPIKAPSATNTCRTAWMSSLSASTDENLGVGATSSFVLCSKDLRPHPRRTSQLRGEPTYLQGAAPL
jgi:hypothetical protein